MPRTLNRLSVRFVETAKPGKYPDGGNLYLLVGGSRRWVFLYKTRTATASGKNRKAREMGLGTFPAVTLARARELAADARKSLAAGIDPIDSRAKDRQQGTTFGALAKRLHESRKEGWRNAKHRAQWLQSLKTHAAVLWGKPVGSIAAADVVTALKPIWYAKAETASRVRGRIEAVLDAARVDGLFPADRINPATWKGNLSHFLPRSGKLQRGHFRSMPYQEVPTFLPVLGQRRSMAGACLRFTILTASRSGESLGASWPEIAGDVWTIPGSRMKGGKEHVVPLSRQALELLDQLRPLGKHYVFPGEKPGRPLSGMAMEMQLRKMKIDATPHGFRSSFRVWAAEETSFEGDIAEMCLSHVVGSKVHRAYQRSQLLDKRRQLLQLWADYCCAAQVDNVVRLRG